MRLTILCCAVVVLSQEAPTEEPSGSIRGKVVDGTTGAALKKATVSMDTVQTKGKPPKRETAVTDENGSFELKGLPAGVFELVAQHRQYPQNRRPVAVSITDGEQRKGVEIKLTPGGAITGRVTGEDGEPLAGCYVWSIASQPGVRIESSRTNDRGEYRLFNVAPGRYYLQVRASRRLPQARGLAPRVSVPEKTLSYTSAYYPGAPDRAGATPVTVQPGVELQGIDIRMKPEETVIVAGKIELPPDAGPGFRETSLQIMPQSGTEPGGQTYTRGGKFQFENVTPGSYWISTRGFDVQPVYARVPVEITHQSIAGIVVPLRSAWQAPLNLEFEGTRPNVWISAADDRDFWMIPTVQQKGDDLIVDRMRPGKWRFQGSPGYVASIHFADRSVEGDTFEVREGERGPLRVVVSSRMATLSGNVESTGDGVPRILVRGQERLFFQVYAAASGQFEIRLPPGDYWVLAAYDVLSSGGDAYRKLFEKHGVKVTVKAGETVSKTLKTVSFEEFERDP